MSNFTYGEIEYLQGGERRLARIATIGPDGVLHIAPVGYSYNSAHDTIDIGGYSLQWTKKYRDIERDGRVAVVIDDVLPPWQPRGIEIRGHAEALSSPQPLIRVHPGRIVSWGIESREMGDRHARSVKGAAS
jgi:pyridoxamine 5'-phosphate oxidase family protein